MNYRNESDVKQILSCVRRKLSESVRDFMAPIRTLRSYNFPVVSNPYIIPIQYVPLFPTQNQ